MEWVKSLDLQAGMTHAVGGYLRGRLRTIAYAGGHGTTEDWNRWRSIRHPDRAQAVERLTHPQRIEGFTYARDCSCPGRHDSCAGRTERFGQDWIRVLECDVDWRSSSSVGVARWSFDGKIVSELSDDLRSGTLARQGHLSALVRFSERSDRYSSSGQTDRADGCAMHGLAEFAWVHSERSFTARSCRDKGGQ